jgi:ATP-dependent Lon protease
LSEIPDDIKSGLIFHPVTNMDEVLNFALRGGRPAASMAQTAGAAITAAVPPPHTH